MLNPTQPTHQLTDLATRARAEFREMPGMCLTTAQAARLWQLSPARAEELLSELVQASVIVCRRRSSKLPAHDKPGAGHRLPVSCF